MLEGRHSRLPWLWRQYRRLRHLWILTDSALDPESILLRDSEHHLLALWCLGQHLSLPQGFGLINWTDRWIEGLLRVASAVAPHPKEISGMSVS